MVNKSPGSPPPGLQPARRSETDRLEMTAGLLSEQAPGVGVGPAVGLDVGVGGVGVIVDVSVGAGEIWAKAGRAPTSITGACHLLGSAASVDAPPRASSDFRACRRDNKVFSDWSECSTSSPGANEVKEADSALGVKALAEFYASSG
jgi:hypothetical protein